jgi:hypothetical protein
MRTLIRLKTSSLGDTIGASPYFEEYRKLTGEIVTVSCKFLKYSLALSKSFLKAETSV